MIRLLLWQATRLDATRSWRRWWSVVDSSVAGLAMRSFYSLMSSSTTLTSPAGSTTSPLVLSVTIFLLVLRLILFCFAFPTVSITSSSSYNLSSFPIRTCLCLLLLHFFFESSSLSSSFFLSSSAITSSSFLIIFGFPPYVFVFLLPCTSYLPFQFLSVLSWSIFSLESSSPSSRSFFLSSIAITSSSFLLLCFSLNVLPLHRGAGVDQQLYQSVHLRRQVPRVPGRRQTSEGSHHRTPAPRSAVSAAEWLQQPSNNKRSSATEADDHQHLRYSTHRSSLRRRNRRRLISPNPKSPNPEKVHSMSKCSCFV